MKKNKLVLLLFQFLFYFIAIVYYLVCASDLGGYYDDAGYFQRSLNIHDHNIYVRFIELFELGAFEFVGINNNMGIAIIYSYLGKIGLDYPLLSFCVNGVLLVISAQIFFRICDRLELGLGGKMTFFYGVHLFYFSQLINKDMPTVFLLALTVYLALEKKYWLLLLMVPFYGLVRIQLIPFVLIFIFLHQSKKMKWRLAFAYCFTSLFAGYVNTKYSFLAEDTLGSGISRMAYDLSKNYFYIGYLILNPVRLLQWLADLVLSYNVFTESNGVDVGKMLRIPLVTVAIYYLIKAGVARKFRQLFYAKNESQRVVLVLVLAFTLTWLINPTVNARYTMLILPYFILYIRGGAAFSGRGGNASISKYGVKVS